MSEDLSGAHYKLVNCLQFSSFSVLTNNLKIWRQFVVKVFKALFKDNNFVSKPKTFKLWFKLKSDHLFRFFVLIRITESMSSRSGMSERSTRSTRSQSKSTPQKRQSSPSSQSARSSRQRRPATDGEPSSQRSTRSLRSNHAESSQHLEDQTQDRNDSMASQMVVDSQPGSQPRSEASIRGSVGLLSDPINLSSPLHYGSTDFGNSSASLRSGARNVSKNDST